MGSRSWTLVKSGGAISTSSTMSCPCPPECCPKVEKEEDNYSWLLIKVLYVQWFVMAGLAVPIIAKLTYLEEELPLVCLITFLFLLLSIPLVFNSHQHKEPSCVCDFDNKEGKKNYKVITKKKRRRSASTRSYKKKSSAHKLLKKKSGKRVKEDDDDESSSSTSSSSSSNKVLKKMPMKPVAPTRPMRIRDDEEAETKVVEVGAVEVEEEQQVKVKLELEPVESDGKTETKVDFKLDVEV